MTELNLDGIILAQAGLERLRLGERIAEILDPVWMLPAVGQGRSAWNAGWMTRRPGRLWPALTSRIRDMPFWRSGRFSRGLGGGCQVPIATLSRQDGNQLVLRGAVLSPDGSQRIADEMRDRLRRQNCWGSSLRSRCWTRGRPACFTPRGEVLRTPRVRRIRIMMLHAGPAGFGVPHPAAWRCRRTVLSAYLAVRF